MNPLELDLPEGSLVIGDLHLDVEAGDTSPDAQQFARFLKAVKCAPVLVILGDLFEYWLGPKHAKTVGARALCDLLGAFPKRVVLIPGNRDALAGSELEVYGIQLAPNGLVGTLPNGARVKVLHGDELCIHDHNYQRLRRILRSSMARTAAKSLPFFLVQAIAQRLRKHSKKSTPAKASLKVAQDLEEAARQLFSCGAQTLIVGHAHQFRDEPLSSTLRMLVLDAFGGQCDLLQVGALGEFEIGSSLDRLIPTSPIRSGLDKS